jgi:hypothetical protein
MMDLIHVCWMITIPSENLNADGLPGCELQPITIIP